MKNLNFIILDEKKLMQSNRRFETFNSE